MADSPLESELTKLFKRRRHGPFAAARAAAGCAPDPFAAEDAGAAAPRIEPLDLQADLPPGCPADLATRLVELRDQVRPLPTPFRGEALRGDPLSLRKWIRPLRHMLRLRAACCAHAACSARTGWA